MNKVNSFKNKSSIELGLESLQYINRKIISSPKLSGEEMKAVSEIRKNGYTVLPNFVDQETLQSMKELLEKDFSEGNFEMPVLAQSKIDPVKHKPLLENYLSGNGEYFKKNGVAFDRDEFESLAQCVQDFQPATLKSFFNPTKDLYFRVMLSQSVRNIVESYMGIKPYLIEAYTRRNFSAKYPVANHHWHRDTNNKTFLVKAFLFLSDCDLTNGPHHYVRGSHKSFELNHKIYYTQKEVEEAYDLKQNLVLSKVKAGTLILEDTRGLHRAGIPEEGHRDLVYGVFFPVKFYSRWRTSYYTIEENTLNQLEPEQKSYIPRNCIV